MSSSFDKYLLKLDDRYPRLKIPVKTADVLKHLEKKFANPQQYVAVTELRAAAGTKYSQQAFDFWVMDCFPSNHHERTCFEVKVSRADFLKEIKDPRKRRMGLALSNRFYFIAPEGIVKIEEVPPECGLYELYWTNVEYSWYRDAEQKIVEPYLIEKHTIQAPRRDPNGLSWAFVAALARSVQNKSGING